MIMQRSIEDFLPELFLLIDIFFTHYLCHDRSIHLYKIKINISDTTIEKKEEKVETCNDINLNKL